MPNQPLDGVEEILEQESEFESEEEEFWKDYILDEVKATHASIVGRRIGANEEFLSHMGAEEFRGLLEQICAGFYLEDIPDARETPTPLMLANYISTMITQDQYEEEEAGNQLSEYAGMGLLAA